MFARCSDKISMLIKNRVWMRAIAYHEMNKMVLICINGSSDGSASQIFEWIMMETERWWGKRIRRWDIERKIACRLNPLQYFHWHRESNKKIKSNFINVRCQMNSVCWMNIITIIINVYLYSYTYPIYINIYTIRTFCEINCLQTLRAVRIGFRSMRIFLS